MRNEDCKIEILPNFKSDKTERGMSFVKVTHIESGISATSYYMSQKMALEDAMNKVRIVVYAWENEFDDLSKLKGE